MTFPSEKFQPGDRVICINNKSPPADRIHLEEAWIYRVKEVTELYVYLEPSEHCHGHGCEEARFCGGWDKDRFVLFKEAVQEKKKKCDCPIDILCNQGCQCGGE